MAPTDTLNANVPSSARPAPGRALLDRLENGPEIIGIVHWGLNTYTDREWGFGDEDPALLAPDAFDAGQIVSACRAGGLGGLVIVAKHHDGFCLWPTKTTAHNISKSPFRGGEGDYVREMAEACRRAGLKFGVYVSPWDRNSAHYATDRYVDIYHAQIRELLGGGYGDVFEMWFDGAMGGDGFYGGARETRRIGENYYRFPEVFRFVRELQPGICIFAGESDGSDFRWPGNETGELDPDSCATICAVGGFADHLGGYGNPEYKPHINTGMKDYAGEMFFRACECDFPLRKGWFFHEGECGTAKSPLYLAQRYLGTVGNGGTMNIGIAPDRHGRLDVEDATTLARFGAIRKALFSNPVTDGPANIVVMHEDISRGEYVDAWSILSGGREIATGKSIGNKRIRTFPDGEVTDAAALKVVASSIATDGAPSVTARAYLADGELLRAVLSATDSSGETDTAKWMVAAGLGK